ncbi:hypothetical protein PISMIDRAFT_414489 [Pisolithus microcarpus 441]|uniref:Uncharacterized protein n=1 Tax=Pisolithus microcarpus 441 TaxID=765257 RepID=A0A0C9ZX38_9AGAM|nr:hypothetical protein BKA83DRAFT_414489 [Pisolithus microcarpus]KIK24223.1 hypothetical protein PISMIDRAFT_414489 [Pisolithus microcarpus 441]
MWTIAWLVAALSGLTSAHLAAWHSSMYCLNGTTPGQVNYNTDDAVLPLWKLSQSDYWFHHSNGCDQFPPAEGDFLELPAGGSFTVEIADNRGVTSLSYNGTHATEWTDGQNHTGSTDVLLDATFSDGCITSPNIHTQNETMASGTAFAIAYKSELSEVTLEDLVVFTVRYNTPWKRLTSYDVPSAMPACPSGGCICAWVWIPNGCGEPNIYMEGFKCMVTNATSTTPLGTPSAPVWCEEDQSQCVQGPKQIMIWNQLEGNNIEVSGLDLSGMPKSPAYNTKCGFKDGAQDDIFATNASSTPSTSSPLTATQTEQTTATASSTPIVANTSATPSTYTPTATPNQSSLTASNSVPPSTPAPSCSASPSTPSPSSPPLSNSTLSFPLLPSTPSAANPSGPSDIPSSSRTPASTGSTIPLTTPPSNTAILVSTPSPSSGSATCKRKRMSHTRKRRFISH